MDYDERVKRIKADSQKVLVLLRGKEAHYFRKEQKQRYETSSSSKEYKKSSVFKQVSDRYEKEENGRKDSCIWRSRQWDEGVASFHSPYTTSYRDVFNSNHSFKSLF